MKRKPLTDKTRETLDKLVKSAMSDNEDISERALIALENGLYVYDAQEYNISDYFNKMIQIKYYKIKREAYKI